jgi:hypothetical protein
MTKQFKKNIVSFLVLLLLFSFFIPVAKAADDMSGNLIKFKNAMGLPGTEGATPLGIIIGVINTLLGLLGLFFVILLIFGGFTFMTSQGDAKKVDKAKAIIRNAVIGVAIILFAFIISRIVFTMILSAVNPAVPAT